MKIKLLILGLLVFSCQKTKNKIKNKNILVFKNFNRGKNISSPISIQLLNSKDKYCCDIFEIKTSSANNNNKELKEIILKTLINETALEENVNLAYEGKVILNKNVATTVFSIKEVSNLKESNYLILVNTVNLKIKSLVVVAEFTKTTDGLLINKKARIIDKNKILIECEIFATDIIDTNIKQEVKEDLLYTYFNISNEGLIIN